MLINAADGGYIWLSEVPITSGPSDRAMETGALPSLKCCPPDLLCPAVTFSSASCISLSAGLATIECDCRWIDYDWSHLSVALVTALLSGVAVQLLKAGK